MKNILVMWLCQIVIERRVHFAVFPIHIYRTGLVNPLEPPIKYNFLQLIKKSVPIIPQVSMFAKINLPPHSSLPPYLTYPHLGPVAGAVVPLDTVVVPGVQDGQTGLHGDPGPLEEIFSIVWLSHLVGDKLGEITGVGPGVLLPPSSGLVSRGDPGSGPGPEPTVDMLRLQMGSLEHWNKSLNSRALPLSTHITAVKVAESAGGPDALHVVLTHDVLHHGVLLPGLHGHQVHTHRAADVSSVQPTGLQSGRVRVLPSELHSG